MRVKAQTRQYAALCAEHPRIERNCRNWCVAMGRVEPVIGDEARSFADS